MNKTQARAALAEIEARAKELRAIIDAPEKIVYDKRMTYVGIKDGCPYLMTGRQAETPFIGFRFFSFDGGWHTEVGWSDPYETAQECLDYHVAEGFDIHAFPTRREAFQFFLDNIPEAER